MNKIVLVIICLFIADRSFAQKTEFSMGLQGNLMHFSGSSATSTTSISEAFNNYTNNPYGNKNGFGFGGYVQGQRIMENNFIEGLQIGLDLVKSKVTVTQVNTIFYPFSTDATGSSNLTSRNLNANPYVGMRFPLFKINLDVTTGIEMAYITSAYDEGLAKYNKASLLETNNPAKTISIDTRIKAGITLYYDRLGITANYAHGFGNYAKGTGSAHSEILRLGISFIIF